MADMINILVKKPGEDDWKKETIEDDVCAIQRVVGGYFETYTLKHGTVIVCNEEGWLIGLEPNCEIDGQLFCGTIFKCKQSGEEFASIW